MASNTAYDEKELLLRVAGDDQEAFALLVDTWRNKVFSHALSFMKSYHEAEELTQDIFMKVWRNRQRLPEVSDFKNYLFILGRNQLVSAIRKRVMEKRADQRDDVPEDLLLPDRQYDLKETWQFILQGVEKLPPQQKAVFTLSRMEQLSHEEISQRLGITRRTVKFHLVQALNTLRERLRYPDEIAVWLLALAGWLLLTAG